METLYPEIFEGECEELERFLSDSIIAYGIDQLDGRQPSTLFCCFRDENKNIIAGVKANVTLNLVFVSHLFVAEAHRNRGLGRRLLCEIETLAGHTGCNILRLNTFNQRIHGFYLRAGFEQTARIRNYMGGFDLVYYHKNIA